MTMPPKLDVKQIATGTNFTIVLMTNGTIYSCGLNDYGQLGIGTTTNQNTLQPMTMPLGRTATYIAAGDTHTVAVMDNGTLYYCGPTRFDIPLDGTNSDYINKLTAIKMNNLTASEVSSGSEHIIVLMRDGSLHGLGLISRGQLGNGTENTISSFNNNPPYTVSKMTMPSGTPLTVKKIVSNSKNTIVLMTNGTIYGCGWNTNGELGIGNTTEQKVLRPMTMPTGTTATDVAMGNGVTVVLMNNGTLYYCGNHGSGFGQKTKLTQIMNNIPWDVKVTQISHYMIYGKSDYYNYKICYYTNYNTQPQALSEVSVNNAKLSNDHIDMPIISSSYFHTVVLIRR
jgi:alpha-tubulin suppressor-like RCC1 family protein